MNCSHNNVFRFCFFLFARVLTTLPHLACRYPLPDSEIPQANQLKKKKKRLPLQLNSSIYFWWVCPPSSYCQAEKLQSQLSASSSATEVQNMVHSDWTSTASLRVLSLRFLPEVEVEDILDWSLCQTLWVSLYMWAHQVCPASSPTSWSNSPPGESAPLFTRVSKTESEKNHLLV